MAGSISFDGLVSGINSSEIVSQLMALERQRNIVPLQRREAMLTAKQAAWRDVRSGLAALQSKLTDLKLVGTYTGMKASSANEEVVMATAKAGAGTATYTIKVEQLATAQQMWSKQFGSETELGVGSGTIQLNGVDIEYGEEDNLTGLAQKINEAMKDAKDVDKNRRVSAIVVDGRLVLSAMETGENSNIELGGDMAGQALWQELGLDAPVEGLSLIHISLSIPVIPLLIDATVVSIFDAATPRLCASMAAIFKPTFCPWLAPVSYTHLDVYKRQGWHQCGKCCSNRRP